MTHAFTFRFRLAVSLVPVAAAVLSLAAWRAPFHLHLVKSVPAANTTVGRYEVTTGTFDVVIPDLGYIIFGAGAPTSAPIQVPQ